MKKTKKVMLIILAVIVLLFSIIIVKNKIYATTTLPKVYITVDDIDVFKDMAKGDEDLIASLTYEDGSEVNFSSNIKIKVQGSSSAAYPKKNYTIKLYEDSECSEKQKVDMGQGWGEFNKYCLKANWIDDKTHSRNVVTAKLASKMQAKYGLFEDTPNNGVIDGFPVEIYLNGEFWGLYTWNIPKDAWMWNLDEDDPNNIAMVADACCDSTYFKKEITSIDTLADDYWEIEVGSETQETVDKFNRLISFVKDSTDEEFKNNIDSYMNKDAMLNYLVVQYLTLGYDNVAKNMILVTYDGEIWYPTLYDLDTTWGTTHRAKLTSTDGVNPDYEWVPEGESGYKTYAPHANDSLLLKKVIRCFPDELAERWFELRNDIFSKEEILAEFNDFIGSIPEATYALEAETWNANLVEYLEGLTEESRNSYVSLMGETIPGYDFEQIKGFIDIRLPYIDQIMYSKYTTEPTLSVSYSTETATNGTVTATVVANRSDITFGTNPTSYTFSENGTYTFTATDGGGNAITAVATVDWIDTMAPKGVANYSIEDPTNQDVIVTIVVDEKIKEVDGWEYSEDALTLTKTYSTNKTETIEVYDLVGNKSEVEISVSNIDKTVPEIEVSYDKTEMTNGDVKVTLTANEEIQEVTGWELSEDKKVLTKTYVDNGAETVSVYDIAGNKSEEKQVSVNNIDKVAPEIEVSYDKTEMTKEDVIVTITSSEEIQDVTGWELSGDKRVLTKTYTDNGLETVSVYDIAGNKSEEKQVSVNNIDKVAPVIKIGFRKIGDSNEETEVTITANEELQEVTGWELSENKLVLTKIYTQNVQETIEIKDLVGNTKEVNIDLTNIDNTKPVLTVDYSETNKTNNDVEVTITANEEIQEVTGWELSEDNKILTKTFTANGSEIVTVYDLIGNESQVQVSVDNIDRAAPEIEVSYDKTEMTKENVIVTITANEEIQEVTGWELSVDKKVLTKTYTDNGSEAVSVYDIAGNKSEEVQVTVDIIDKTLPEIKVSYDKTEMTNEDVKVTITADEEIQGIEGWLLSEDKKTLTKTYIANDSETVAIYDLVGNKVEVQVNITNIDKTGPKVEIKTSKEEMTNEDILVTLIADEEIQEVEGWLLSEDKLTLTKTYDKNVQEKIEVKDLVGNVTEVEINLINIDKTNPKIKLDYSDEELTNGDVVVIITSEEEMQEVKGWNLSEDKKTLTKTYEENQKETIEVKDLAGNITKIEINIANIDKIIPEAKVEYSSIENTNEDVVVTITVNEEIQEVNGWELSKDKKVLTKTYDKNAQEIIKIKDLAGNIVEKNINISNIDKEKPVVEVNYSTIDNKYVTVKIISTEQLQKVEGWELSADKMTLTKTYEENTEATIEVKDLTGNITLVEIKIDNIKAQSGETEKDAVDETDKNEGNKEDNSTATGSIPNAGSSKIIIIAILALSISLGITISKLKKYKGI